MYNVGCRIYLHVFGDSLYMTWDTHKKQPSFYNQINADSQINIHSNENLFFSWNFIYFQSKWCKAVKAFKQIKLTMQKSQKQIVKSCWGY